MGSALGSITQGTFTSCKQNEEENKAQQYGTGMRRGRRPYGGGKEGHGGSSTQLSAAAEGGKKQAKHMQAELQGCASWPACVLNTARTTRNN